MDSREYAFIFPLRGEADVPADFRSLVNGRVFEHGIFIPRNDPKRFAEDHPPCLMLLAASHLRIILHPAGAISASQSVTEFDLCELAQLEAGRSLLRGWLEFSTPVSVTRVIYNTRASAALDLFLTNLRRRWLGTPAARETTQAKQFGHTLDIKFGNLLADALDPGEFVRAHCFNSPAERADGIALFRKKRWRPGHLLALTSGNRLLLLKDEYRGHQEPYASISIWAPLCSVTRCHMEAKFGQADFVIDFSAGASWRIAIGQDASGWVGFSKVLNDALLQGFGDSGKPESIPQQ